MDTTASPGQIHSAIVAIMASGPSVAKSKTNTQQNYRFRGIDDLYLEMQPLMAKHGVHVTPHRVVEDSLFERPYQKKVDGRDVTGTIIHVRTRIEFRFWHCDGSYVSVETTGEAMDHGGDKASNKAMSAAMKYALVMTFSIPTDEPIDTEHESPDAGSARPAASSKPGRPQRPPPGPPQTPPQINDPPAPKVDSGPKGTSAHGASTSTMAPAPAADEVVPVYTQAANSKVWAQTAWAPKLAATTQARIKILGKELAIDEKSWREKLFQFYGKTSSSQLSVAEAVDWIGVLESRKRGRASAPPAST